MGNPPFEDVFPIKKWWVFQLAMLVYQRVLGWFPETNNCGH